MPADYDDPGLGSLESFPTVLHARASFESEVNVENLQKSLVSALHALANLRLPIELSRSDHDGYVGGLVDFKLGVGNVEAFDIFDEAEEDRLLRRIERRGAFPSLDLSFKLHYSINDGKKHTVPDDRFLARLLFRPGRMEVYVNHHKGIRRVQPEELIALLIEEVDTSLEGMRYPRLHPEDHSRTSRRNWNEIISGNGSL